MATTTNYGWTTPDDTALVKDGAAAIRTLGSSVDTTTKALNPSTTLGDIEYRSSTANTNTRLGIGTTGQVLTVSGGVPSWATSASGGLTLLSTTTLSGATTTISGISGSYTNLFGVITGVTNATADGVFYMQANSGASIFTYQINYTNALNYNFEADAYLRFAYDSAAYRLTRTSANNGFSFIINNYASATAYKTLDVCGSYTRNTSNTGGMKGGGGVSTTSAITSLTFLNDGGNLSTGTVLLYGVK
jgi:hypothetical protein